MSARHADGTARERDAPAEVLRSAPPTTDADHVTFPPDDLPRSPTGRVPQWVLDEAAGTPTAPTAWRTDAPPVGHAPTHRRRRRAWPVVLVVALTVALVGAAGTWWAGSGRAALPDALTSVPWDDTPAAAPPTAEVVALADEAHLSDEGRDVFYATSPELLDAAAFAGRCTEGHASTAVRAGGAVGCYLPSTGSIVLYQPADARLRGFVVETAAHEMLHAAWERLTDGERTDLEPLLESEVALLAADDPIHEQLTGSVGDHPENRPTELFAYVGTQVWRDGGLAPELEATYSRFIADRAALVAVHDGWQGTLDQLSADLEAASQALTDQEYANATARAQLQAETAAVDSYRDAYLEKQAEVSALPADERARLRLSWVWWDGTELSMQPADDTLAAAADLLARDDAAMAARAAELDTADAAAAAERTRVEGLVTDLRALQAQLDPATA